MARTTQSERRRPWTRLRAGLYLALSSILLLEVVLRFWAQFPGDSRYFVTDPEVGFRARPHGRIGASVTNSVGFNDAEHPAHKPQGVTRIAFVGDSFVFGVVPRGENLVSAFRRLAARDGRAIETFNLGIPAAGPENYLGLVRHDVARLAADVVCVVFFVGNDVFQAHPDFKTRVWFGAPRALLRSPWLLRFSGDYLYSYKLVRGGVRWTRNRLGRARDATFSKTAFLEIEQRSLRVCRVTPDAKLEAGYRGAVELIAEMRRESERRGQRFLVVLAPDRFQVDEGLRATLLSRSGETADRYDFDRPQTRLHNALEPLGIEVLDLLPAFRERGALAALYRPLDTHWNGSGNALAGELVYRFLTDRTLMGIGAAGGSDAG